MSGLDYHTILGYTQGETNYFGKLGEWIDGVFVANSSSIEAIDAATDKVVFNEPKPTLWSLDSNGQPSKINFNACHRTKIANVPNFQFLKLKSQNGSIIYCGSKTPVVTRIGNDISNKLAEELQVGDFLIGTLHSYTVYSPSADIKEVREVEYQLNQYSVVPVVTETWGYMVVTRQNCEDFLRVVENYPEQVVQSDWDVFNHALSEMTYYDEIVEITDVTNEYRNYTLTYLYWLEAENNACWQIYYNSTLFGTPLLGVEWTPKPIQAVPNKKANVEEILKSFKENTDASNKANSPRAEN